ncbi:MAG: sulfite exporter TauE/SafE family protein [Fibrobacterota bacterium]
MCPNFLFTWQSSLLFILAGTVMGAVGGGGALLALPVFLLVLQVPMELAVPATTAVVGFAALPGAWDAWNEKRLDLSIVWRFAIPGMAAAAVGAFLSPKIPGQILHWSFFGIVAVAGVRLLLPRATVTAADTPATLRAMQLGIAGAGTGALMGLFGVGGGFLVVPALVLRGGLAAKVAIPVSLATMALNAASSLAVQIPSGNFRWTFVVPALVAVLVGMEFGGRLSRRLPERALERILGVLLLAAASWLVWGQLLA